MKFKRILSGFLAAAMAVTTMVTASVTAGAEDVNVWSGSVAFDTSWGTYETVAGNAAAKAGDILKITCAAVGSESYHQVLLKNTSYGDFTAGGLDAKVGSPSLLLLNETDAATVNAGFLIGGYDCTVTSIDLLSVSSSDAVWSGSVAFDTSWGTYESVTGNEAAKAGDVLKITCSAVGSEGYHQVLLKNSSYADFSAGGLSTKAGSSSLLLLNEADAATVNAGFLIGGYDCTITKIELLSIGAVKTAHTVTVDTEITNGNVEATPSTAMEGEPVNLTVTPADGYKLDTLTVMAGTTEIPVTSNVFTMPDDDVTVTATFVKEEVPMTGITLDKTTANIVAGKTVTLTETKAPENMTDEPIITWSSSDETVATVENGVVTGIKAGDVTITVTAKVNDTTSFTATCKVTVSAEEKPCTKIELDQSTATIKKGESVTLKETVTPTDTTEEIKWTTSDAKIATVEGGKVTGVARGKATITVECGEQTATCEVSVTEDKEITPVEKETYSVPSADGKTKTVDTVYKISKADLAGKGYKVTITNTKNNKTVTKEITSAYKSVTVRSEENLGNDTYKGYYLVVRVINVPSDVTLSFDFEKIS